MRCVPVKLLSCIVSGAGDDFPLAGQARMPKALEMGRCLYGEHLQHHWRYNTISVYTGSTYNTTLALQHHICLYGEHLQHHFGATQHHICLYGEQLQHRALITTLALQHHLWYTQTSTRAHHIAQFVYPLHIKKIQTTMTPLKYLQSNIKHQRLKRHHSAAWTSKPFSC